MKTNNQTELLRSTGKNGGGENVSSLFRAIIKVILVICSIYVFLVIFAYGSSSYYVDESFKLDARKILNESSCDLSHGAVGSISALLNPIDFASNYRYWTASLRLSDDLINKQYCVSAITKRLSENKRAASVVFVNDTGRVVVEIKN